MASAIGDSHNGSTPGNGSAPVNVLVGSLEDKPLQSVPPTARPNATDDPGRLASLYRTELLESSPEEAFDRFTRLAARLLDAPVALVSLVEKERQFVMSAVGLPNAISPDRATSISHFCCQHVINSGKPLVVSDARKHPLLQGNPEVIDYGALSYCGFPIVDLEGRALGALCVIDDEVHDWSLNDLAALGDIAQSVINEVHLRLSVRDLSDKNEALNGMISEASHGVRNQLGVITMYASLLNEDETSEDERRHFTEEIRGSTKQATRMISDLLGGLQTPGETADSSDPPVSSGIEDL